MANQEEGNWLPPKEETEQKHRGTNEGKRTLMVIGQAGEVASASFIGRARILSNHSASGDLVFDLEISDQETKEFIIEVKTKSSDDPGWTVNKEQVRRYGMIMEKGQSRAPLLAAGAPTFFHWLWIGSRDVVPSGLPSESEPDLILANKVIHGLQKGYLIESTLLPRLASLNSPERQSRTNRESAKTIPVTEDNLGKLIRALERGGEAKRRVLRIMGLKNVTVRAVRFIAGASSKDEQVFTTPELNEIRLNKLEAIYIIAGKRPVSEALHKTIIKRLTPHADLGIGCLVEGVGPTRRKLQKLGLLKNSFDPRKSSASYPIWVQEVMKAQAVIMLNELRDYPYVRHRTEEPDDKDKYHWVVESRGPDWYHQLFYSHGKPRWIGSTNKQKRQKRRPSVFRGEQRLHSPIRRKVVEDKLLQIINGSDQDEVFRPKSSAHSITSSIRAVIFDRLTQGYNPTPDNNPEMDFPADERIIQYFQKSYKGEIKEIVGDTE